MSELIKLGKREQGSTMPSMVGTHAGGEAPCEGMEGALREHEKLKELAYKGGNYDTSYECAETVRFFAG